MLKRYVEAYSLSRYGLFLSLSLFSIDATNNKRIGKLINDSPKEFANAKMSKMVFDGKFHLCLFAIKDVCIGEEIRYDYQDFKENLWWRKKVCTG